MGKITQDDYKKALKICKLYLEQEEQRVREIGKEINSAPYLPTGPDDKVVNLTTSPFSLFGYIRLWAEWYNKIKITEETTFKDLENLSLSQFSMMRQVGKAKIIRLKMIFNAAGVKLGL